MLFRSSAFFPRNEQVSTCQKTRHGVSSEMMYPAFFFQLRHCSINPRESSLCTFPLGEVFWIVLPRDLFAYSITNHFIDRKSVVLGKSVELGGRRIIKKKLNATCSAYKDTTFSGIIELVPSRVDAQTRSILARDQKRVV